MAILNTEMVVYKAFENSSDPTNGGILTNNASATNAQGNVFPDISDSERLIGSTLYRKMFWKINNTDNKALTNAYIYMSQYTVGADWVTYTKGTQTDTESDITGTERYYGAAPLEASVTIGATTFNVVPEDAVTIAEIIKTGDDIMILDSINQERHDNITAAIVGDNITITLDVADQINNNFDITQTFVASVCPIDDVEALCDAVSATSVSGQYDDTTYPLEPSNKGALEQTWTLTFSNTTQFTCSGNIVGYVGTGDIETDFAPMNATMNSSYFMLRAAGWGAGWLEDDTLTITTHPAAQGIWFKRVVPAGATSSANRFEHRLSGEAVS